MMQQYDIPTFGRFLRILYLCKFDLLYIFFFSLLVFVIQVLLGSTVTEGLVYSENKDCRTPLHIAAQYGNLQ